MEPKVGMYIRINGFITRICHIRTSKKGNTYIQFKQPNGVFASMNTKQIGNYTKFNYSPINLIEVGDYVNGKKVEDISIINDDEWVICFDKTDDNWINSNEKIKSIVTKEQFKAMEYKIGG